MGLVKEEGMEGGMEGEGEIEDEEGKEEEITGEGGNSRCQTYVGVF